MEHLLSPKLFPYTLAFLDLCASIVYLAHGNIRLAVYWFAAMTLTLAVTME